MRRESKKLTGNAIREKNVAKFAQKTGEEAIKVASQKKASITIAKNGRVYVIHPDGTEKMGRILPKKVTVKNQTLTID